MKISWIRISVMIMIVFGLAMGGCAKKAAPPQETAPVQQEAPKAAPPAPKAPEAPAPVVEAPKAPAPTLSLADEIKAFEDADIHFDFDKYNLKPEAIEILQAKGAFLKSHADLNIQVEGHCDERGTVEYNLALGDRRAKAAQEYLVTMGINKERVSHISYGKEKPVDAGHTEEAWAKNRRCHFLVTNK